MSEYIVDLTDVEKKKFSWSLEMLHDSVPVREEITRCRDCKYATVSTLGYTKYCEKFVLPDIDGYGFDSRVNLPLDFYCAWGERRDA